MLVAWVEGHHSLSPGNEVPANHGQDAGPESARVKAVMHQWTTDSKQGKNGLSITGGWDGR